jgi:uncharacterized phage-associated protein
MTSVASLTKSQSLLYTLIKGLNEADDKVKLAKLAYFADFIHYAFHDKPISEETNLYQKRNFGPLSVSFNADLKYLLDNGLITSNQKYHFKSAKEIKTDLDEAEMKTVGYVLGKYSKYPFDVLADISHKQIPYLSATEGSVIDYNTAYNLVEQYPDYAA